MWVHVGLLNSWHCRLKLTFLRFGLKKLPTKTWPRVTSLDSLQHWCVDIHQYKRHPVNTLVTQTPNRWLLWHHYQTGAIDFTISLCTDTIYIVFLLKATPWHTTYNSKMTFGMISEILVYWSVLTPKIRYFKSYINIWFKPKSFAWNGETSDISLLNFTVHRSNTILWDFTGQHWLCFHYSFHHFTKATEPSHSVYPSLQYCDPQQK